MAHKKGNIIQRIKNVLEVTKDYSNEDFDDLIVILKIAEKSKVK
jgi:hypothetical protein